MISRHAATSALAHARELAAHGATLTDAMTKERAALLRAIDVEVHSLDVHAAALAPAAKSGDSDAAAKLLAIVASKNDLCNARAALAAES